MVIWGCSSWYSAHLLWESGWISIWFGAQGIAVERNSGCVSACSQSMHAGKNDCSRRFGLLAFRGAECLVPVLSTS